MQIHPTKQKIIDIALELFVTKGYEATTLSKIIEISGISKGGIYHHFGSKEDIADEVLTNYFKNFAAYFEKEAADKTPFEQARLYFNAKNEVLVVQKQAIMTLFEASNNSIFRSKVSLLTQKYLCPILAIIIKNGVNNGDFQVTDPDAVAFFISQLPNTLLDLPKSIINDPDAILAHQKSLETIINRSLNTQSNLFEN